MNKFLKRFFAILVLIVTITSTHGLSKSYGQVDSNLPEKFTVHKVNKDGEPLEGAEFEFKDAKGNLITGAPRENDPSLIDFPVTSGGMHTLIESKAPEGYVRDKQEYKIPIGVPFKVPEVTKDDVTDRLKIKDMSISAPIKTEEFGLEFRPDIGQFFGMHIELGVNDDFPDDIKPGDYFYLDFTQNFDLMGISPADNFDLNLPGELGTIAESEYILDDANNINRLKFTFTDYVDIFQLDQAYLNLSGFIDRNMVRTSSQQEVGVKTTDSDEKTAKIYVNYLENETHVKVKDQAHLPFTSPLDQGAPSIGQLVTELDEVNKRYQTVIFVNPLENNERDLTNAELIFASFNKGAYDEYTGVTKGQRSATTL